MEQAVDSFLKTVLRSGLLSREQLQGALRGLSKQRHNDPQALADHLIESGQLSRFQAHKLLKGTALGLVLGPFQVLSPIGRGGMGTVYLARDTRSDQLMALKVLPPKRAREEERLLARFRREMDMSRLVAHPHIAWTYEVGVYHGVYYIAMEYIPGKSLYRLVADDGTIPVRRAARLFAEVCSALAHAHEQGLVHRDLKPSNILVTPNDHAKVLDLGLALVQGEVGGEREVVGGAGYVVGSMDWIAPEQTQDASRVDARSDVYGLGCTLYYTLSGRPPFPGGTTKEKIQRHRNEEPVRLEQLNPSVPITFADMVHKMMAKAPPKRYPSAEVVRRELLPWVSDEPVMPMDRTGDTEYQKAVHALQLAEIPPELIEVLVVQSPEQSGRYTPVPGGEGSRARLWFTLGFIGFWVAVLVGVSAFLLTR